MKDQIKLMTFLFVVVGLAASAHAQTDLSMREPLYFTGSKSNAIDTAKDKYVAKESTINVGSDLAKSCDKKGCEFNVGVFGSRSGDTASILSTYALFSIEGAGTVGNTLFFGAAQAIKQHVLPLKLKYGENRVAFIIDPQKKIAESNERNNTFSVKVVVSRQSAAGGK